MLVVMPTMVVATVPALAWLESRPDDLPDGTCQAVDCPEDSLPEDLEDQPAYPPMPVGFMQHDNACEQKLDLMTQYQRQYYDPVKCARNPDEIVGVPGEDSSLPVYFTACGETLS